MEETRTSPRSLPPTTLTLLLFLAGLLIYFFGVPYYSFFPANGSIPYNAFLTGCSLLMALAAKRNEVARSAMWLTASVFGVSHLNATYVSPTQGLLSGLLGFRREGVLKRREDNWAPHRGMARLTYLAQGRSNAYP